MELTRSLWTRDGSFIGSMVAMWARAVALQPGGEAGAGRGGVRSQMRNGSFVGSIMAMWARAVAPLQRKRQGRGEGE